MSERACPFASQSVTDHLVRGAGATVLIALTFWLVHVPGSLHTAGAIVAVAGAVVLMRGCPTCWLTGLFATVTARSRRRAEASQTLLAAASPSPSTGSLPTSVPAPR